MENKYFKFTSSMEVTARELVSKTSGRETGFSLTKMLEREISLILDQIDSLRKLRKDHLKSLCRVECYIGTEIKNRNQQMPNYSPYLIPGRDELQNRLIQIEAERRNHSWFYEGRMHWLQDRLLSLIQKHEQLSMRTSLGNFGKYVRR